MSGKRGTSTVAIERLEAILSKGWRYSFILDHSAKAEDWWLIIRLNEGLPGAIAFGPKRRIRELVHEAREYLSWRITRKPINLEDSV